MRMLMDSNRVIKNVKGLSGPINIRGGYYESPEVDSIGPIVYYHYQGITYWARYGRNMAYLPARNMVIDYINLSRQWPLGVVRCVRANRGAGVTNSVFFNGREVTHQQIQRRSNENARRHLEQVMA